MSKSKIKVLRSIPAKYKRQRTKFTLDEVKLGEQGPWKLSWSHLELLWDVAYKPEESYNVRAHRLGLSVGTLKSRLSRARAGLLTAIDDAAIVATFEENLPSLRRRARR